MDNKVLSFPKRGDLPSTKEEAAVALEAVRHVFINEMTELLIGTLLQQMVSGGFNILDDEYEKDLGFLIESVRSTMCRTAGIYHPFQDVSTNIMENTDQEGVLKIAEAINVKFRDEEKPADAEVSNT